MKAAQEGLNSSGQGGFFIEHPTFTEFKDQMVDGMRQLRVETQTIARVPAPILLFDNEVREHGDLTFRRTYIVEFKGKSGWKWLSQLISPAMITLAALCL